VQGRQCVLGGIARTAAPPSPTTRTSTASHILSRAFFACAGLAGDDGYGGGLVVLLAPQISITDADVTLSNVYAVDNFAGGCTSAHASVRFRCLLCKHKSRSQPHMPPSPSHPCVFPALCASPSMNSIFGVVLMLTRVGLNGGGMSVVAQTEEGPVVSIAVTVVNCTAVGNVAQVGWGGGIDILLFAGEASLANTTVTLTDVVAISNNACGIFSCTPL
jgi:hypothetical protein